MQNYRSFSLSLSEVEEGLRSLSALKSSVLRLFGTLTFGRVASADVAFASVGIRREYPSLIDL